MTQIALDVTARELMQHNVICVASNETLFDALELMTENHVTGVPVLDANDRCIGLVSSTDILEVEHDGSGAADFGRFYDPDTGRWEDVALTTFHKERLSEIRVSDVMSSMLISVAPDAKLTDICAIMSENEVHRLLVVDEQLGLHGLISSTDVVSWIADQAGRVSDG
jgi:CBS domain-containing protein